MLLLIGSPFTGPDRKRTPAGSVAAPIAAAQASAVKMSFRITPGLELIPQSELELTCGCGVCDQPEAVSIQGRVDGIETHTVRKIVRFGAKLERLIFHNSEVLL